MGGRECLLVDIPPIEKFERVVLIVWERPRIHVDFLTVWNSIDKSSKPQPYMHVRSCALNKHVQCIQTQHKHVHAVHRLIHTWAHTLHFLSVSHPSDKQTCTYIHTHTDIPEVVSGNVGQSCVGISGSMTQLLSQTTPSPHFTATRLFVYKRAGGQTIPVLHVCICTW